MARQGSKPLAKNARTIEGLKAQAARATYMIDGAPGLRLIVHPSGTKVWYVDYQRGHGDHRKRRWHKIGTYSAHSEGWTLAKAVEEAGRVKAQANSSTDPDAAKMFGELFDAWLQEHAKKRLRTWRQEESRYRLHLEKALGAKPIGAIERKDVREIRDEVLEYKKKGDNDRPLGGPIESNRVVALFNRVMNWAVDEDRAKFNPAARLKKVGEEQRRERFLSPDEIARLWAALETELEVNPTLGGLTFTDLPATLLVRRAIKLLLATGQRRAEVIGMRKSELDLTEGNAWWLIPKERTKNKLPHRVPLTKTALAILADAIRASGDSKFVFPSVKTDGAIRADAVTKTLQRMCSRKTLKIEGVGPHDLRRTVGTTMRKLGVSVEDRGYVFNHVSGAKSKVTSWNYDAGEHDDEKRRALDAWDRELRQIVGLDASSAKVLTLKRPA